MLCYIVTCLYLFIFVKIGVFSSTVVCVCEFGSAAKNIVLSASFFVVVLFVCVWKPLLQ